MNSKFMNSNLKNEFISPCLNLKFEFKSCSDLLDLWGVYFKTYNILIINNKNEFLPHFAFVDNFLCT